MIGQFFADASLFVGGVVVFAAMLGARELGAFARRVADRRHESGPTSESDANVLLSVALGLLSLLLGFAFSLALSRYDDRRELVTSEASAIATAAQRIGLLDAPARDLLMRELRDYTAVRASAGLTVDDKQRRLLDRRADGLSIRLVESASPRSCHCAEHRRPRSCLTVSIALLIWPIGGARRQTPSCPVSWSGHSSPTAWW